MCVVFAFAEPFVEIPGGNQEVGVFARFQPHGGAGDAQCGAKGSGRELIANAKTESSEVLEAGTNSMHIRLARRVVAREVFGLDGDGVARSKTYLLEHIVGLSGKQY